MNISHYCGGYTALTTTRWGAMIYVDTRDTSLAPHIMVHGDWEPWVTNAMAQVLKENRGCTFIDVGANVGWYTLLACGLGAGRVYSFEPNPRMVELLRKTVTVNGFRDRVTLTEAACGAAAAKAHLRIDWTEVGGASLTDYVMADGSYSRTTEPLCEVVRLDDAVKARPVPKDGKLTPIIMKIDVEGYEPQVLAGAPELLVFRPILFIEHHRDEANTALLRKLHDDLGYDLRHVQHSGHLSDRLIVPTAAELGDAETILCTPKESEGTCQ